MNTSAPIINKKVNLFIIGVSKAGTSWLHFLLEQHPDIYMSKLKEHYFFGKEYPEQMDNYHGYFPFEKPYKYFGESSHNYNLKEDTAKQINEYCPNAKLLAIVRDPIQRLVSQYYFQKQTGVLKESDRLEDAINMANSPLLFESHYERNLPVYEKTFSKRQFKIVSLEAAKKDPALFWTDIQNFLELEPVDFPPSQNKSENATGGKLFRFIYRLTITPIKKFNPSAYKLMIQNSFMHKSKTVLLNLLGTAKKEKLSQESLTFLKKEFEPTYDYLCKIGYANIYQ